MKKRQIMRRAGTWVVGAALSVGLLVASSDVHAGPDGRAIMVKVAETRKLDKSEAVLKMSMINEKGESRDRSLTMASKLFDGGKTEKRIYRFQSPADVKGTGILVYDYDAQADDVWVFLPALRKTRRIVSSQRSSSFMGSEFSYADLNIPSIDEYTYNVKGEENVGGEACHVIEVLPKSDDIAKSEGYKKKVYWVSKEKNAIRKGEFYDMGGKLLKELKADNIQLLDPAKKRSRAMKMEMVNKQNGRRSVFQSEKVSVTGDTKDDLFTTRYLERT